MDDFSENQKMKFMEVRIQKRAIEVMEGHIY